MVREGRTTLSKPDEESVCEPRGRMSGSCEKDYALERDGGDQNSKSSKAARGDEGI